MQHYRRYRLKDLEDLLRFHGFRVIWGTHFVTFLFPVVALSRLVTKLRAALKKPPRQINVGLVPGWLNWLLTAVLLLEARIATAVRLPIGVRAVVLVEKAREPN